MPVLRPRTGTPDYRLCCHTVTIYHWDGEKAYTTTVRDNAYLDFRKNYNVDRTGSREANSFLLLLPGDVVPVAVGDKVLVGRGEEISSREEWAALLPSKVPGLVVVKWVDPKYQNGRIVHTEAGG